MRNRTLVKIVILTMVLVSSACGSSAEPQSSTPELSPTLAEIVPSATPTASPPRSGKEVYDQDCLSCHRLDDVDLMGPGLAGLFEQETMSDGMPLSDESLAELIARGTIGAGAMPGIRLTTSEMEAVIAYLKDVLQ